MSRISELSMRSFTRGPVARWWRVVRSASYGFIPYVVNGLSGVDIETAHGDKRYF